MERSIYEARNGKIVIESERSAPAATVDQCFIVEGPCPLPKSFTLRDTRVFPDVLTPYNGNRLLSIRCSGKITTKDLKAALPLVFDVGAIKRNNRTLFLRDNLDTIEEILAGILTRERILEILAESQSTQN